MFNQACVSTRDLINLLYEARAWYINTFSVVSDLTAGNLTWKLGNMVPHPRDGLNPGGVECNDLGRYSTTNQLTTARDVYPRAN